MPNFDGTGPRGQGSKTGRARGGCSPGQGKGKGSGMGFRRMFWTDQERKESLQSYQEQLERELEAVRQEIADLE